MNHSAEKSAQPAIFLHQEARFYTFLVAGIVILTVAALVFPLYARFVDPSFQKGRVAPDDILAPRAFSYVSEVLTERLRDETIRSIADVYTQPDTLVARQQLEQLRLALTYISSVRADTYANQEQKLEDLTALEKVALSQESAISLLGLSDARWQAVQQEAIVALEQVMRSAIREDRLDEFRRKTPTLVSLSLSEKQAGLAAELAAAFVAPNSFYSEALTEEARRQAYNTVHPVERSFMAGETIIQRGRVLTAADIEALQQAGLLQPQQNWQDLVAASLLAILLMTFMIFYLRRAPRLIEERRSLTLIAALFLVFLFGARLITAGHTITPYAFPLTAYSLVVASLFGAELALVSSLPLAVLAAYGLSNSQDLTMYYVLISLFGVLALGPARRVASFAWAGLVIGVSGACVILVFRLPQPTTDWMGLATLSGASFFNGLAAVSLTLVLQFFLSQLLGTVTPLQLMELARPDHPLLRLLLRDAPGTYQHSLQVSNLAEQAAEAIGADSLLVRIGALYHDAGKALNPIYFIENQLPGFHNPHEDLDPTTSAQVIIRHVQDGVNLAHKYHLPRPVIAFIREHHGTLLARYQYARAVTACNGDASQVDASIFRYPGPAPQSRETALLMLADGCEARVRAEHPESDEDLRRVIKSVVDGRVASGQFDHTNLTLQDLNTIVDTFAKTLRNMYHPRIAYPQTEPAPALEEPIPVIIPPRPLRETPTSPLKHPTSQS